jgi:transcriptional regulator NrdR family protein
VQEFRAEVLDEIIDSVVEEIYPTNYGDPIPTKLIAETVLAHLKERDKVSHIRFALVSMGRRDRTDYRSGWKGALEFREWLHAEYPGTRDYRPPPRLDEVVKRNGRRETFDLRKLSWSIGVASKGRGNSDEEVRQFAIEIADDVLRALGDQPIVTTGQLSAEVLRSLRKHDDIAYLRYASAAKGYTRPENYEAEAVALLLYKSG